MLDPRRTSPALLALLISTAHAGRCFQEEEGGGWVRLFDGASLEGWVTEGGRYDGNARWSVEDGALVGREGEGHAGGLLYTADSYENVELELEVWTEEPFDSGIFLRMRPDAKGAQVTLDYRPGGEVGGIYSDGWYCHNEDGKAAFRGGEWNHFRVRCTGHPMHLEVWMNGAPLTDYRFPDGDGFAREGLIGLQVHGDRNDPPGSKVLFRELRARRLPPDAGVEFREDADGRLARTEVGLAAGWKPLLEDGLPAWEENGADGIELREGVLEFQRDAQFAPALRTRDRFAHFEARMDVRAARGAVAGLFLLGEPGSRIALFGSPTDAAMPPEAPLLEELQRLGDELFLAGKWHTVWIRCQGGHVGGAVDGIPYLDATLPETTGSVSGPLGLWAAHPGPPAGDGPWLSIRNFFVRPLGGEDPAAQEPR